MSKELSRISFLSCPKGTIFQKIVNGEYYPPAIKGKTVYDRNNVPVDFDYTPLFPARQGDRSLGKPVQDGHYDDAVRFRLIAKEELVRVASAISFPEKYVK
ncbi:hypothetical protein [Tautonia plasticadhaerens]|uniref:Uncharacterized protein n=1 Tax=Tautonia plasticadhaerens TaxID=2527974 RepID=A0A518H274_9BACT|nr:hypothetical protein [Tautonia plasticadhaerens]QDV34924.1 hypothetical protein ElP_28210 [Tautonia plasticadhaerens]